MLNFAIFSASRFRLRRLGLIAFLVLTRIVTTASEAQAITFKFMPLPQSPPPRTIIGGSHLNPGDKGTLGDVGSPLQNPAILNIQSPGTLPGILVNTDNTDSNGQMQSQSFENIIESAADCWAQALPDNNDPPINLNIGVAPFYDTNNFPIIPPGACACGANPQTVTIDGTLAVQTGGTIIFNSNVTNFFVGPTSDTSAANQGYDLYTVALHEIGHALGFTPSNPTIGSQLDVNGNFVLNEPYPIGYGNITIPTTDYPQDIHLVNSNAVMYPKLTSGQRKLLTGVDILAVAGAGKYQHVNLSACPFKLTPNNLVPFISIPEPSPLPALLLGGGAVLVSLRRWNSKDDSF